MSELPTNAPDLPSIKITHRVLGTAADGDDADTSPDLTAITGLRVRFTPLVKVAVWTGTHGPVTHAPIPVEGGYDNQGMLRLALADGSLSPTEGIRLLATTDPDLQPSGWSWQAAWDGGILPTVTFGGGVGATVELSTAILSKSTPITPGAFDNLVDVATSLIDAIERGRNASGILFIDAADPALIPPGTPAGTLVVARSA